MQRVRIGAGACAATALGLAVWQMAGPATSQATGPVVVAAQPLRPAAGTPVQGWAKAPPVAETLAAAPMAAEPAPPVMAAAPDPCAATLEVFAEEGAMLGLTLQSPCHPNMRVEISHGGLTVAMQTLATGSLFATLPALDPAGQVSARFEDDTLAQGAAPVPELATMRRFAVEWQQGERLELNGFEGGADYGDPGHSSVANGGVLLVGDPMARPVRMAEIYDFPDPSKARVTIEAEVTANSCGRSLRGKTVYAAGGAVRTADLVLSMPDCDGAGGFVVLNNPLPDMTLAAAE